MRGIYFITEGATETYFVESCLYEYFFSRQIFDIRAFNMGGSNSFQRYYRDVTTFLRKEKDVIVTSMIDFFRLPNDFPGYQHAMKLNGSERQITAIENEISQRINHPRFVPYIQLHEFEALLFSDLKGFNSLAACDDKVMKSLRQITETFENPEQINDGPETAPSRRLIKLIPGYKKVLHGALVAKENGLEPVLRKCPRFRNWLEILERKTKVY